ncbi:extracellular solute-binding protein [Candidatus Nomurabacteria bacterium]|nr:extracellular solute-binding protein [Candidatus Nomurabacteria bacterium]
MNNFQTILTAVFLAFFVFAVLIFSGMLKIGNSSSKSAGSLKGKVVIWGTFESPEITRVFEDATTANRELIVTYVRKQKATYQQDLIEAMAVGKGPDLFFITPDMVVKNEELIYKIPYTSYPEKTFRDSFIDGADVYLTTDGIIGFPVVVDPLVMYYNKDLLANEGLSTPPTTWDEVMNWAPTLTKKKDDGTILQSMIALGQYQNVTNAKDIIATLLLQNNNSIIKRTETGYSSVLEGDTASTAERVLNFFVQFSNPSNPAYSWNRAIPNSVNMFTGGKLVFYLGHASELFKIQSVNPNLSFDVTSMPQASNTSTKRTYSDIYAISVNKKSANVTAAFGLAGLMSTGETASNFASTVSLPPASRALLASKPKDPYLFTFFNQAIISRTWLDPNSTVTDSIFSELVENVLSNRLSISDALAKAQGQLDIASKK